jgi:hypothetical protein
MRHPYLHAVRSEAVEQQWQQQRFVAEYSALRAVA